MLYQRLRTPTQVKKSGGALQLRVKGRPAARLGEICRIYFELAGKVGLPAATILS